jgi:hypothetical protein
MMQMIALFLMIVVIPVASLTLIMVAAVSDLLNRGPRPPRIPNPSLTRTAWRKQTGRP